MNASQTPPPPETSWVLTTAGIHYVNRPPAVVVAEVQELLEKDRHSVIELANGVVAFARHVVAVRPRD